MANKSAAVVAEIALYGTSTVGAGYIARTADGRMFGNGEPVATRSFTSAVWLAIDDLRTAGVTAGLVQIFASCGTRMATVEIGGLKNKAVPYFGDLNWTSAPVYTISAESLEAAR